MAQRYKKTATSGKAQDLVTATQDEQFVAACKVVGIPPTRRQWRKWNSGAGLARSAQVAK
tara:strand:- start:206 stop:385 length:180 start_codon:yes stop_codon:yes gene_type:complete